MKRFLSFLAIALVICGATAQSPFTQGNLAVLRVGDGSAALSSASTAIFIDEFTPAGTLVQSVAIPTNGDNVLTNSGTATSEGQLTLSPNGLYLTLAGYNTAPGTASINGTSAAAVNRKLLRVDNGVNYTPILSSTAYNTNNIRGGVTTGDDYWASGTSGTAGANGVQYFGNGTPAQVSSTVTNIRVINIFSNQLYFSTGSGTIGLWKVGTGTPTTTGQTSTNIIATGTGSSPYAFAFNASSNICYIADDRASGPGGVQKWTESAGIWTLAYTLSVGSSAGARGLTVDWSGINPVIYATTTGNKLVTITDTGSGATFIELATAGTNTAYRGVAFAPASAAGSPQLTVNPNQLSGFSYLEGSGPSASQSFAIGGSDLTPETGNITVQGTTNYEVSLNNSTFQNSVSFGYTGGEVVSQTVWVRLKAGLGAGTYNNENVTVSGGGAAQKTVACNGTVSSASVITVGSVNPFGNQEVNTVSAQQSYLVSAVNLGDELEIYAPAGFEISKVGGLDFTPSNPILLSPIGGTVAPTSIYVRFTPTQAIAYSGNITHDSPGAFTQNVPVSGTGIYGEPTNYPTDFTASAPAHNAVDVSWTDASTGVLPDSYLIKGSTVGYGDIADPVDGVSESNALLVRNVAQGIENYTFTGLQGSTTYYFKIYPYTGSGASINYKTSGSVPQADATTPAGPALSEVIMPQYMQGFNGTNNNRTPFAYRLNFENLNPNATYRYINQMVLGTNPSTDGGAGNIIFVNPDNTFSRTTSTSFSIAGQYGEFTTDAAGSFTGWFITEPTGNARFTPGNEVYVRVRLNDGAGGTSAVTYLTSPNPIKVINYGDQANLNEGTGVYGPSDSDPKNFVFLYDNSSGSGRPITGSFVENDGTSGGTAYPAFYQNNVNENDGYWGAIIPNVNSNGILRLEYRDLTTGNIDDAVTDSDGIWNGSDTKNPVGGLNAMLLEPDMSKNLSVLFFLEGPYNGTFMNIDLVTNGLLPYNQPYDGAPWNYAGTESVVTFPPNVVDWVLVELRDATAPELATPATKLAGWPKAMFVRTDGQLVDLDGFLPEIGNPVVNNNLYIVIRHRNHVDIMSADGLLLTGNTYSYDFTGSVNQAYGGSLGYKLLNGGACGMASGDMDADGKVFASDFVEWATDSGLGDIYSLGDLDFDGNVFASDFVLWAGNSGLDYPVEAIQPDVPVFVTQVPDKE